MATKTEFQQMAQERLNEAEILFKNKSYNGANYIAGYAVEFALKASICTCLDVEMFDEKEVSKKVAEPLKIHNLETLLVFSGLFKKLQSDRITDRQLDKAWSIVSGWSEERRYDPKACNPQTVRRFLDAIIYFLKWIQTH